MLERRTSQPTYEIIAQDIRNSIILGTYTDSLPGENSLGEKYNTSRITVRKALSALVAEGLIYSQAGKGYFISKKNILTYNYETSNYDIPGLDVHSAKLIDATLVSPDIYQVYEFYIHPNSRLAIIKTLLEGEDGNVIAYEEKYIPYYPGMSVDDVNIEKATLERVVTDGVSNVITSKKFEIMIVRSNETVSGFFKIPADSSIIEIKQMIYDEAENLLGTSLTYCQIHNFQFEAATAPMIF